MKLIKNPYLLRFFNSNSLADIAPVFDNYKSVRYRNKEITESMGCLRAIDFTDFDPKDLEVECFIIGDGTRARTGFIFAYFTSWWVTSIDPLLDMNWFNKYYIFKRDEGHTVRRLSLCDTTVEDFSSPINFGKKTLLVLPHSHADISACLTKFRVPVSIISLPCCTKTPSRLRGPEAVENHNYITYQDRHIITSKSDIHIWKDLDLKRYQELGGEHDVSIL